MCSARLWHTWRSTLIKSGPLWSLTSQLPFQTTSNKLSVCWGFSSIWQRTATTSRLSSRSLSRSLSTAILTHMLESKSSRTFSTNGRSIYPSSSQTRASTPPKSLSCRIVWWTLSWLGSSLLFQTKSSPIYWPKIRLWSNSYSISSSQMMRKIWI